MRKILVILVLLCGCEASDETAHRALKSHGFTDVNLGGYPFFQCSQDDEFNREFTAKNARGERVSGAVCCGMLKSCTVRFD